MPKSEEKKPKEFHARLVTPEEMPGPRILPPARIRPIPAPPRAARKMRPLPSLPPTARSTPSHPPIARQIPGPPVTPTVPGEGRGTGKAPTEESRPGTGTGIAGKGSGSGKSGTGTGLSKEMPGSSKPGFSPGKPDWDVISRVTQKGLEGKKGTPDKPITFDTKEYKFSGYMTRLKEKIESIWVYPPEAAERGIYGDLEIQFTIKKDGRLGEIRLVRTSGYKMLDDAALKALRDGERYWPLPDAWHMESYTILGHFVYMLYGGPQLR
jgi:periplasmic protein TonB